MQPVYENMQEESDSHSTPHCTPSLPAFYPSAFSRTRINRRKREKIHFLPFSFNFRY